MSDTVPPGHRIDRSALERIIQRAAEIQAHQRDFGDEGLTEHELLQLGQDVGLSEASIRQAIVEERTRAVTVPEGGLVAWLAGPRLVTAERVIALGEGQLEEALHFWMDEGESLQVKRRFPEQTTWEPRRGAVAALRRSLRGSRSSYQLARCHEVRGTVTDIGAGHSHVRLMADVSRTRKERVGGAITLVGLGAVAAAVAGTIGVEIWAAMLPLPLSGLLGYGVVRSHAQEVERTHVALEQVLDRLEHQEIKVPPKRQAQPSAFQRIADEIRRQLSD